MAGLAGVAIARNFLQEVMVAHVAHVHEAGNELRRLEVCAHLPARLLVVLPSSMERAREETVRRHGVLEGRRSTP
ncbi:unnamed protein product [Triticum turgidum subsp. durum]|uniref:Uncharacterized protein n=1 Tax=Triticum turgidum subsp. durum TaxID=4567 RepID=A0A9R1BJC7_TRITD|nr:unnamed protein product [Triticum turgidum subsp. durum]